MGLFRSKKENKIYNIYKNAEGQEVISELPNDLEPLIVDSGREFELEKNKKDEQLSKHDKLKAFNDEIIGKK